MKKVKIIKNWDEPDLLRQTPGGHGVWDEVQFSFDQQSNYDYLIVLNYIPDDMKSEIVPGRTWGFMQEPYIEHKFDWVVQGHEQFDKVFTHHMFDDAEKYVGTQTCLPWHIGKSIDELLTMEIPMKNRCLSWITSNKTTFPGHKVRMKFYEHISTRKDLKFDLFGYGFNTIVDKWQGLAAYQYSLAIENSSSEHYWTEKVSDCLLSYSLPFYYGCTNLEDYLPSDSFIRIDINDVEESVKIINAAIASDQWNKRLDAIRKARLLILNEHQLFPFIANQINQDSIR